MSERPQFGPAVSLGFVTLLAVALLGCSSEQLSPTVDSEPPTLVVHGARVFDGEGILAASTVLLRNDRILAIQDESPAFLGELFF